MRYLFLTLSILIASPSHSEPLPPASFADACRSQSIVEAEYTGYQKQSLFKVIRYFEPPTAKFLVTRHIYGAKTAEEILVRYDFQDGSACIEQEGWKFSESLMPKENSKWILFLSGSNNGIFSTYRGDFGRVPLGSLAFFIIGKCSTVWGKP